MVCVTPGRLAAGDDGLRAAPDPDAARRTKTSVFVLAIAVPALLVVLLGYSVGYGAWAALVGDTGAEPAGWVTGLVLLLVTVRVALTLWRRRRR